MARLLISRSDRELDRKLKLKQFYVMTLIKLSPIIICLFLLFIYFSTIQNSLNIQTVHCDKLYKLLILNYKQ